ncbi:MAG: hypothetical protein H0W69_10385, partial [Gemmatimonadaceae bacterium]|nr:hypothetical protein [Gemmatimonadaceae bacterium]
MLPLAPVSAQPENISVKKSLAALLAFASLAHPSDSAAQKKASVFGAVVDSLHGGWLAGAEVTITGSTTVALTDSLGRFRFDSVSPGIKQVGVFHPLLESLGISLGSHPFKIGSDSIGVLMLGVPSARSLLRQLCNVRTGEKTSGVMMGRVIDPDLGTPVQGSRVTFRWTDYEVKRRKRLNLAPQTVVSVTDESGTFKACGLPIDVPVRMQAWRNGVEAPDMEIQIGGVPVAVTDIAIRSADSRAFGIVTGKLTDTAGVAISGAYMGVERVGVSAMTDSSGQFSLSGVPTGTQILVGRKIGYTPMALPVLVGPDPSGRVAYVMSKSVPILEDVRVRANANVGLARVGFTRREETALGTFLLAADIEKLGNPRLSEVLGSVYGLSPDPARGRGFIKSTRDAKSTV